MFVNVDTLYDVCLLSIMGFDGLLNVGRDTDDARASMVCYMNQVGLGFGKCRRKGKDCTNEKWVDETLMEG